MGTRADVIETLQRLAFGTELLGESAMRARAYANAARALKKASSDLRAALDSGELAAMKGVGAGTLKIVRAVLDDTPITALVDLEARVPPGILDARRIRGLGAKKIARLWRELELTSVAEIEYACTENRLAELPGFGPKTQDKTLEAIAALRESAGRFRLDEAQEAAREAIAALQGAGVEQIAVVGDLRRGRKVVESVVLLARNLGTASSSSPGEQEALAASSIAATKHGAPVVVRWCPDAASWPLTLLLETGSEAHIAALRAHAAAAGTTLEAAAAGAGDDESAIYRSLGLHPTPPERREAEVPLVGLGKPRPSLVTRGDLRGALHNHTTASDGVDSLEAMRAAAAAAGLEYLHISEHSQTAAYAGGLPPDVLLEQARAIAAMNAEPGAPCQLLTGVESDILEDGGLDYGPDVLSKLDLVVASVHRRHSLERAASTARMVRAASDPWTAVIGHPTGRILLGRPPVDFDVDAFLDACAASGCAVELNANPQRLDLEERWLRGAKERGVPVSISADAHSAGALRNLEYGVTIARRAGLGPEDVLNCRPLGELRAWMNARRPTAPDP